MPHVTGIFIYPVKSCRGHAVSEASVGPWGFNHDRHYMIVSPAGEFFTQRQLPRLALIDTALTAQGVTLAAPGYPDIAVARPASRVAETLAVNVWSDTVLADDCGDEISAWLTGFLGLPARLVHAGTDYFRPVKPSKALLGDTVSFADGYPFLAISEASVAHLNDRIVATGEDAVPADRFRANLVIADCAPFAEDEWRRVRIGEIIFRNAGPCARCVVTTTDQHTGERGKEPLRTLATFRRDTADPTDVNFGVNLIHETKTGTVRVGDSVALL